MINLCQLKELSCFGCCGHDYKSIEEIKKDIKKNTRDFEEIEDLNKFRDRANKWDLRKSGVCKNIIEKKGEIFCPLHPSRNNGFEYREDHCEIDYLCNTFKLFLDWNKKKQDKFLRFIKEKKLNNYTYSILMDSDKLLEEFNVKDHSKNVPHEDSL